MVGREGMIESCNHSPAKLCDKCQLKNSTEINTIINNKERQKIKDQILLRNDLDSTRKELEELRGKVMEWNLCCCKFTVTGTEEDYDNMVNTANLLVAAVEKQANALSVY